jgi:hypothetical protein
LSLQILHVLWPGELPTHTLLHPFSYACPVLLLICLCWPGEGSGLVKFETAEQRSLFYAEFVKAEQGGSSTGSSGQFQVKFPGGTSGGTVKSGVKRPAGDEAAAAGGGNEDGVNGGARKRKAKELKSDIREVVCPWWERPYADQLQDKMGVVNGTLRALTEKVSKRVKSWLSNSSWSLLRVCCWCLLLPMRSCAAVQPSRFIQR